jgi:hypothetical protein
MRFTGGFALALAGAYSALALSLSLSPEDEAARDIALQWLGVVDSGNYKDAALLISEQVRGSRDWTKYFAAHRAPLGRVDNRKIAEVKYASTVPGDPEVRRHAIVRFKTSFEHPPSVRAGLALNSGVASKAAATEEIVLMKMGCCWEVCGYSITAVTSDPPSRKATARQASDE